MGKHVPSGNLFPTVRTWRPTIHVYLSTKRVCLPTNQSINWPYVSTGRLHRTATRIVLFDGYWATMLWGTKSLGLYHAGITLPPTTDCAAMPTIYKTTAVPIRLLLQPDHNCADTPTVPPTVRSCRYACDPRLSLVPYCYTPDNR